jgi:hypothetical protein
LISSGRMPWSRIILCMKKFSLLNGLGIAIVFPSMSCSDLAGSSLRMVSCDRPGARDSRS